MGTVIDARFVFDAKRALTHAYLRTGNLQRTVPTGGTVERLPTRDPYAASLPDFTAELAGDTPDYLRPLLRDDEDWSWLEEFTKEPA